METLMQIRPVRFAMLWLLRYSYVSIICFVPLYSSVSCMSSPIKPAAYEPAPFCDYDKMMLPPTVPDHALIPARAVRELEHANALCGTYHYDWGMANAKAANQNAELAPTWAERLSWVGGGFGAALILCLRLAML